MRQKKSLEAADAMITAVRQGMVSRVETVNWLAKTEGLDRSSSMWALAMAIPTQKQRICQMSTLRYFLGPRMNWTKGTRRAAAIMSYCCPCVVLLAVQVGRQVCRLQVRVRVAARQIKRKCRGLQRRGLGLRVVPVPTSAPPKTRGTQCQVVDSKGYRLRMWSVRREGRQAEKNITPATMRVGRGAWDTLTNYCSATSTYYHLPTNMYPMHTAPLSINPATTHRPSCTVRTTTDTIHSITSITIQYNE